MHYTLSYSDPQSHLIHVAVRIENIDSPTLDIQLPAWRPGRYELANYAKNTMRLAAFDANEKELPVRKLTKDRWQIETSTTSVVRVTYAYYAQQMDAGGSWLDDALLYVNFVNCCVYAEGRQSESCTVRLHIPDNYHVACGLPFAEPTGRTLLAESYYQLVDCPLIASATLRAFSYRSGNCTFHLWLQGTGELNWQRVLADFKAFTDVQISTMGDFPCPDYHFLFHWLPTPFYHGVEHQNSTVIVLGPSEKADALYPELLGISSHELFHTWNVIRIRPQELTPYDFTRENYFSTGFVAEGVTTYYGDLFLVRSGVYSLETYLMELNKTLNRHFTTSNAASLSLIESSIDLWVDGYAPGVPNRKVSIYQKGALVALILDLEIRQFTNNTRSLDDVMRRMWNEFGKTGTGYSLDDYCRVAESVAGKPLTDYFTECIAGTAPLHARLREALQYVGCDMLITPLENGTMNVSVQVFVKPEVTADEQQRLQRWLGSQ